MTRDMMFGTRWLAVASFALLGATMMAACAGEEPQGDEERDGKVAALEDDGGEGGASTGSESAGPTTTTSTGSDTTSGTTSSSSGMPSGPACCEPMDTPGCAEDAAIEACVCAEDPYCCGQDEEGVGTWDELCTQEVGEYGCAEACPEPEPDPVPNPDGTQDCCEVAATPGCLDDAIEQCVCAQDAYCCETEWDDLCIGEVNDFGCGTCVVDDGGA